MKNTLLIIAILCSFCAKAQITAAFSILGSKIGCGVPHAAFFADASTNADTWLWNFGDGGTSTVQNPIHNYLTAGTFVVQLTVQNTTLGITDIAYDTVKVSDPVANIGGPAFQYFGCAPLSVNVVDASTSSFGIASWAWTFGDGGTSTLQNPTYIYQTPGVYDVTLSITDSLGCVDTRVRLNEAFVIGPDVNFGADQTVICPNTTVNFTDSTIFGSPIISWTWNFGDGSPTSGLQNPSHTYVNSNTYTVSLTVTDIDGCSRTFTRNNYIQAINNPDIVLNSNDAGPGSLRQVITDACPGDTITFDPSTNGNIILLTGADIDITKALVIIGNGQSNTIIDGDANSRIFEILNADSVSISQLTIQNGSATGAFPANIGGGISANTTSLVFEFVTVRNNSASRGGGISSLSFSGPSFVTVSNSTISGNSASRGGGIYSETFSSSSVTVSNSTISGNSATSFGGGIYSKGLSSSLVTVSNSTISGNSGTNFGGGIVSEASFVSVITLGSSIVAFNTASITSNIYNSLTPRVISFGYNVFSDASINNSVATDQLGATAATLNLGPLQNNGGAAETLLPGCGSIAINMGNPADFTAAQNGSIIGVRDAGAAEYNLVTTISCPSAITINTDIGVCTSTAAIGTPTGTNQCNVPTNNAPAAFPIGNTTVTWSVLDAVGSAVTCTQMVTVIDNENPFITCPADITINTDVGICTSTAAIGTATATDNCGVATITNDAPAVFPIGATTVTWTATDGSGNTATCSQIVTVVDAENPVITCPITVTINTDIGLCSSTTAIGTATATDNCSVTITNNAPVSFAIGNTTVTWTATDGAGNTATCTQVVTVIDAENPVITCPAAITINTDVGFCSSTTAIGTATATDNCTVTVTNNAPVSFAIGNTTVLWTATDGSGNTATCTQIVTVIDAENPVITCPLAITINTDAGLCTSTAAIGTATATDNCSVTITNNAPVSFAIGNTTVLWAATDGAGNTATCTQIVTVVDAENPVLTCPADQTVIGDNNCEIVLANYILLATVSDNCDVNPVVTQSPVAGTTLSGSGANTITLTATDVTGNVSTCTFLVNISDTTAPVVNCLANQIAVLDANCEFFLPDYGTISSFSDNCDATLMTTQTPSEGTLYTDKEIVPVTIVFQDAAGNTSSCSFMVDIALNPNNPNCGSELVITTLFTPNGDGKNDTWIIRGLKGKCTVMVFNRWGQKVFESSAYNNDWNGTANGNLLPDGAYYYIINCDDDTNYKGPLTILRTK